MYACTASRADHPARSRPPHRGPTHPRPTRSCQAAAQPPRHSQFHGYEAGSRAARPCSPTGRSSYPQGPATLAERAHPRAARGPLSPILPAGSPQSGTVPKAQSPLIPRIPPPGYLRSPWRWRLQAEQAAPQPGIYAAAGASRAPPSAAATRLRTRNAAGGGGAGTRR